MAASRVTEQASRLEDFCKGQALHGRTADPSTILSVCRVQQDLVAVERSQALQALRGYASSPLQQAVLSQALKAFGDGSTAFEAHVEAAYRYAFDSSTHGPCSVEFDFEANRVRALEVKNADGEVLASLQPPASVPDYRTRSGAAFTSVDTLSPVEREQFLNQTDPVRRLALNDDSVFYRGMPRERVVDGRVAGNPDTMATILNHQAVKPNPLLPTEHLTPAQVEQLVSRGFQLSVPVKMNAYELPDPSLNVAFGPEAEAVARAYAKGGVVVKMRLGDLRAVGGGMVFDDASAVLNRPGVIAPLVVTLPQGTTVPVRMV